MQLVPWHDCCAIMGGQWIICAPCIPKRPPPPTASHSQSLQNVYFVDNLLGWNSVFQSNGNNYVHSQETSKRFSLSKSTKCELFGGNLLFRQHFAWWEKMTIMCVLSIYKKRFSLICQWRCKLCHTAPYLNVGENYDKNLTIQLVVGLEYAELPGSCIRNSLGNHGPINLVCICRLPLCTK